MERLTEQLNEKHVPTRHTLSEVREGMYRPANFHTSIECYNKLGRLEDIEEELGCDLITLFKALNSCWFRKFTTNIVLGDIRPKLVFQGGWYLQPNLTELPMIYALKDYGKTWALTKEELCENMTKR